jgi:branched-chain amino acid transport system permease protein
MRRHLSIDRAWVAMFLVGGVGVGLTLLLQERYHQRVLQLTLAWATMGLAWNIISGYAGQISFGHQVFFGLGAYTTVLLMVYWHITPWLGLLASMLVGVVAAVLIGLPTFRLAGIYFALATLAYPLTLQIVMDYLGYQEVTLPFMREKPWLYWQFMQPLNYSWLFLGLFMATLLLSHRIERSRLGYYLRAIKENDAAAAAMGVDVFRYKMLAYILSSLPASALGGLFVHAILFVATPADTFGVFVIVETLTVALVGGVGSKWGAPLGATFMIPLGEFLDARWGDTYPGIQRIVFGMALVLVTLLAREGLFWKLRDLLRRGATAGAPALAPATAMVAGTGSRPLALRPQRPDSGAIMDVQGISKAFTGLQALSAVTFTVQRQEILGVIGPNGAGKTTLFNVLNGFLPADAGQATFQGSSLIGLSPSAICKRGIGRTFQVARPFARLSVLENVMIGAFAHTAVVATAQQRAQAALSRVGLDSKALLPATGLTTLDLRLMELARCLATQPRLVLLDEPLAGLGGDGIEVMMQLVQHLRQDGITVVIIEHTMQALVRLTDRLVVLDHGVKVAEGPPEVVTRHPQVIEAYLGKRWLSQN